MSRRNLYHFADGASQAVNSTSPTQPLPVGAAEGSGSGRRPSVRGGGISAAAATAVAQIRRRRTAARATDFQAHASSSAATVSTANRALAAVLPASADPTAAAPNSPDAPHHRHHAAHAQPGPVITRAADLSSAAPQQSNTNHVAHSQPAEATDQAAAGASRGRQPMDRAVSVSRPPLPFHAIRRSARLHKAADTDPSGPAQPGTGGQTGLQGSGGNASAAAKPLPDGNMATEACGPCTRYAPQT